jgi:uncharacterized membrane protein
MLPYEARKLIRLAFRTMIRDEQARQERINDIAAKIRADRAAQLDAIEQRQIDTVEIENVLRSLAIKFPESNERSGE